MPIHDKGTFVGTTCAIIGTQTGMRDVHHVGLLATEIPLTLQMTQLADVYDMGRDGPAHAKMRVDLMGCLSHLDDDTQKEMRLWARNFTHRGADIRYHVRPASMTKASDTLDGPPTYWKFSCAGFVERCYRDVGGIQLVVDEECLPLVELDMLKRIWPDEFNNPRLNNPIVQTRVLRSYGLEDNGPWPILMPAYLFHAIAISMTRAPRWVPISQRLAIGSFLVRRHAHETSIMSSVALGLITRTPFLHHPIPPCFSPPPNLATCKHTRDVASADAEMPNAHIFHASTDLAT